MMLITTNCHFLYTCHNMTLKDILHILTLKLFLNLSDLCDMYWASVRVLLGLSKLRSADIEGYSHQMTNRDTGIYHRLKWIPNHGSRLNYVDNGQAVNLTVKVAEEMTDFCVLNGDPTNPQSTGQTVFIYVSFSMVSQFWILRGCWIIRTSKSAGSLI